MEAHQLEDCKSSSEETDRSEQSNDEIGTGRSYECVFCKRGFTTAQALGGHMNIHRKDRAKSRPSSVPPIVAGKAAADHDHENLNYASIRSYSYPPMIQSYHHQPHYSNIAPPELHVSYQAAFFPASSGWGFSRPPHTHHNGDELYVDNSQHLNQFGEDCNWARTLSLRMGPSHVDDENKKTDGSSQEDELDLELRLGHHDP